LKEEEKLSAQQKAKQATLEAKRQQNANGGMKFNYIKPGGFAGAGFAQVPMQTVPVQQQQQSNGGFEFET